MYFQVLVPLHILFNAKGRITPERWLQLWSADVPQSNEDTLSINSLSFQSKEQISNKLAANSVYIIAERVIDEIVRRLA